MDSKFVEIFPLPVATLQSLPTFKLQVAPHWGTADLSWTSNSFISVNTYDLQITYNDPNCAVCSFGGSTSTITGLTSPNYSFSPQSGCFSWKVRSVCADGTIGEWTNPACAFIVFPPPPPQPKMKSSTAGKLEFNEEEKSIAVLPNPSTGLFNLSVIGYHQFEYNVMDINGKLIIQQTKTSNNSIEVDLSNYPGGMYFLNVINDDQVERIKLIKEN